jgi:putative SOS response-associated peptidase YedK
VPGRPSPPGTVGGMCGRYASTRSATDLASLFDALDETEDTLRPDYNVAPTDPVPIVRLSSRATAPVLSVARWGLVPAWSRDTTGAARMINARAETVATSRAFAGSFVARRCLVPADGWYEWVRLAGRIPGQGSAGIRGRGGTKSSPKQAYFMTRRDGDVLALGGIWTAWSTGRTRLLTFSVVTLPAQDELALVHDRMPLVLQPDRWADWLTSADPTGLLAPPGLQYAAGIESRPVSPAVGDVHNDGPELTRRVAAAPPDGSFMEPPGTLF